MRSRRWWNMLTPEQLNMQLALADPGLRGSMAGMIHNNEVQAPVQQYIDPVRNNPVSPLEAMNYRLVRPDCFKIAC